MTDSTITINTSLLNVRCLRLLTPWENLPRDRLSHISPRKICLNIEVSLKWAPENKMYIIVMSSTISHSGAISIQSCASLLRSLAWSCSLLVPCTDGRSVLSLFSSVTCSSAFAWFITKLQCIKSCWLWYHLSICVSSFCMSYAELLRVISI